jgi:histidine triad (HIT) family protein
MNDCIFCKIVSGEVPSIKLYEDERVIVIMGAFPSVVGHSLVIPKEHGENIFETSAEDLSSLVAVVRELAPKIKTAVGAEGLNISTNVGSAAGQKVFHTHIHILPRRADDGHRMWGEMSPKPDIEAIAEKIKNLL